VLLTIADGLTCQASCESRQFLRHLFLHGDQNTTLGLARSIVILESNTGYLELVHQLQVAGGRAKVGNFCSITQHIVIAHSALAIVTAQAIHMHSHRLRTCSSLSGIVK
jgi:hypothetical protein